MKGLYGILSHLIAVGFGAFISGAFLWFFPNRKDWTEAWRQKREAKIDGRVISAIANFDLWTGSRPMTGAGVPAVRSVEIADQLGLDRDVVAVSLERLYLLGKVRKESGTLDDPSPYWHYAPR